MTWGQDSATVSDRGHGVGAAKGNEPQERYAAARTVASMSVDAGEAAELLACLGLTAQDGKGGG